MGVPRLYDKGDNDVILLFGKQRYSRIFICNLDDTNGATIMNV